VFKGPEILIVAFNGSPFKGSESLIIPFKGSESLIIQQL